MNSPPPPPLPTVQTRRHCTHHEYPDQNSSTQRSPKHNSHAQPRDISQELFQPTWYFFYGTLQSESLLKEILSLPQDTTCKLIPANLVDSGFRLAKWGRYLTLIPRTTELLAGSSSEAEHRLSVTNGVQPLDDGDSRHTAELDKSIRGTAYLVEKEEYIQKLARYETNAYITVDCRICLQPDHGGRLDDRTFDSTSHDANETKIVYGKVFVDADAQPKVHKAHADIDLWQNEMGMSWPLKRTRYPRDLMQELHLSGES